MPSKRLTSFAKNLRKCSTDAERLLWRHVRDRQIEGIKFRRQQPVGCYVVDFVCFEKRIILELDGGQHAHPVQKRKDAERDQWLKEQGFTVLRFWDNEVLTKIEGVLEVIRREGLGRSFSPSP